MNGKQIKEKYPEFAQKHKINDEDTLYLAGDKVKILRKVTPLIK